MEWNDDMKKVAKRFLIVVVFFCFMYAFFIVSANYGCLSGNGTLLKSDEGMRCVDLSGVDLCRDYNGNIIEKPKSPFVAEIDNSSINFDW